MAGGLPETPRRPVGNRPRATSEASREFPGEQFPETPTETVRRPPRQRAEAPPAGRRSLLESVSIPLGEKPGRSAQKERPEGGLQGDPEGGPEGGLGGGPEGGRQEAARRPLGGR